MLKRLVIVYNSRSSKHAALEAEVLAPARKLSGWLVGKYEVLPTHVRDNAERLAKTLQDGDLVIVAGGDGTASVAVNGIMLSEKDVTLGVLGYGNFNDVARMLRSKQPVKYGDEYIGGVSEIVERFEAGKVREVYPLEALVDGKHWRYAPCYITLGMFAESTAVFDQPKVRQRLKDGKRHHLYSIGNLAIWYFKNRKREFLPEMELEQKSYSKKKVKKIRSRNDELRVEVDESVFLQDKKVEQDMKVGSEPQLCSEREENIKVQEIEQRSSKKGDQKEFEAVEKCTKTELNSTESEKNSSEEKSLENGEKSEPKVHFMRGEEVKMGSAEAQEADEARIDNVVKNTDKKIEHDDLHFDGGLGKKYNKSLRKKRREKWQKSEANVVGKTEIDVKAKSVVKNTDIDKMSKGTLKMVFSKSGKRLLKSKEVTRRKMVSVYRQMQDQAQARKNLWEERVQARKEWEEVNRPTIIIPASVSDGSRESEDNRGEKTATVRELKEKGATIDNKGGEKVQENIEKQPKVIGCEVEMLMSHNQAKAQFGVVARRVGATKFVVEKGVTDYLAVNSVRVAGMMKGRRFYRKSDRFLSTTARLKSFPRLVWFMLRSMIWRLPGRKVREDIIRFSEPSNVTIHAEGEHQRLNGVREIRVRKAKMGIKVIFP